MLSATLSCVIFFQLQANAAPLRVTLQLSEQGGAYQEFSEVLQEELKAQSIILNFAEINEKIDDADLIVAVGMKAATISASNNKPVLNVLVPKADFLKLANRASPSYFSAIYLDQPIEHQLSLLVAALPKVRHVGVLYSAPPPELPALRRLALDRNLKLYEGIVGEDQVLSGVLDDLLDVSEVLLVVPDTNIYNVGTIRNILLTSYRKQVPLVGISQAYVKAGALCAIYSTPSQIAVQAAEMIRQFANTGKLLPSQNPKYFEVSVNSQVARSLNLSIKDNETLRTEIRRAQ